MFVSASWGWWTTKQKPKATLPKKKRKRRQKCGGCFENCTTIGLRLARLGCVGFSKMKNSPGETRCKKSWDRFEKYCSQSLCFVKQVSGRRRDHRLGKYKSNFNISEVPTQWNLRTGPMKRLKDKSNVPKAGIGTLPKTFTCSKRTTKLHSTRLRKNGSSRLRQQKSRRRDSLW